jgi:hypothetical protein
MPGLKPRPTHAGATAPAYTAPAYSPGLQPRPAATEASIIRSHMPHRTRREALWHTAIFLAVVACAFAFGWVRLATAY